MENIVRKGGITSLVTRNFSSMFSIVYGTYFSSQMHFKMSGICFNLDQSEIMSSGNGLITIKTKNISGP